YFDLLCIQDIYKRLKELSVAQREQIIGAYISGVKQKVISAQLDIPTSTINDTIKQYKETGFATPEKCPSCPKLLTQFRKYLHDEGLVRVWRKPGEAYKEDCIQPTVKFGGGTVMFWECFETGSATPEKRPGRPKLLTQRDTRVLQRIVHDNRFSPLGDITNKFNSHLNTTLHYNTVRKYLHDKGLEKQRKDRLRWSREKQNWEEEWKNVVWSDESKFALFESDGRVRVWRKPGEAYKEDCIQPTVKFGGGSVMFWGCFGWHGVGPLIVVEGNMDSNDYINILAGHFIPWVNNYPNSIFQQDKAPCHTSNYIRKRKPLPKSKQELINVIQEEWGKINIETLHRLILSLPDRVKAVIKAKGNCHSSNKLGPKNFERGTQSLFGTPTIRSPAHPTK
ncbi:4351_t:CDS:2, partial [Entrophospora sp. SA101]